MTIALIDNGSLEPAAHRNLRALAAVLSARTGVAVHPLSWKHSDRIPVHSLALAATGAAPTGAGELTGRAWTLVPWMRAQLARGEREFVFIPFFISAQGAIGSALRADLEKLQRESQANGRELNFTFTEGLAARGALAPIIAGRIRETIAGRRLHLPAVIVVDHGGPSRASAALRDDVTTRVGALLAGAIGPLTAASLEGAEYPHAHPLFADKLREPGFDQGDVVIAPLFLAPGRHAGSNGDLARIARAAEARQSILRCHFTELAGTHPRAAGGLADALRETLSRANVEQPFSHTAA
jgi:hypothetical protein